MKLLSVATLMLLQATAMGADAAQSFSCVRQGSGFSCMKPEESTQLGTCDGPNWARSFIGVWRNSSFYGGTTIKIREDGTWQPSGYTGGNQLADLKTKTMFLIDGVSK